MYVQRKKPAEPEPEPEPEPVPTGATARPDGTIWPSGARLRASRPDWQPRRRRQRSGVGGTRQVGRQKDRLRYVTYKLDRAQAELGDPAAEGGHGATSSGGQLVTVERTGDADGVSTNGLADWAEFRQSLPASTCRLALFKMTFRERPPVLISVLWAPPGATPVAIAAYTRARPEVDRLLKPDEAVRLPPEAEGEKAVPATITAARAVLAKEAARRVTVAVEAAEAGERWRGRFAAEAVGLGFLSRWNGFHARRAAKLEAERLKKEAEEAQRAHEQEVAHRKEEARRRRMYGARANRNPVWRQRLSAAKSDANRTSTGWFKTKGLPAPHDPTATVGRRVLHRVCSCARAQEFPSTLGVADRLCPDCDGHRQRSRVRSRASDATQYGPGALSVRKRQESGWTAEASVAAPEERRRWASSSRPLMGYMSEYPVLKRSDGILPVLSHSDGQQQTVRLSGGSFMSADQFHSTRLGGLSSIGSRSTPSIR